LNRRCFRKHFHFAIISLLSKGPGNKRKSQKCLLPSRGRNARGVWTATSGNIFWHTKSGAKCWPFAVESSRARQTHAHTQAHTHGHTHRRTSARTLCLPHVPDMHTSKRIHESAHTSVHHNTYSHTIHNTHQHTHCGAHVRTHTQKDKYTHIRTHAHAHPYTHIHTLSLSLSLTRA